MTRGRVFLRSVGHHHLRRHGVPLERRPLLGRSLPEAHRRRSVGTDRATYSLSRIAPASSCSPPVHAVRGPARRALGRAAGRRRSAPSCLEASLRRHRARDRTLAVGARLWRHRSPRPLGDRTRGRLRRSSRGGSTRRRATALSVLGATSMASMSLLVPRGDVAHPPGRLARPPMRSIGLGATAVLLPLALWVVRESPGRMGLPAGRSGEQSQPRSAPPSPERTAVERCTSAPRRSGSSVAACSPAGSRCRAAPRTRRTDAHRPRLSHAMLASSAIGVLGASSFVRRHADRRDRRPLRGRRPVLAWLYGTRALLFAAMFPRARQLPWRFSSSRP